MFVVYVIESSGGRLYTRHTSDLARRLEEHNSGLCKSTKVDTGWQVVYSEDHNDRGAAMRREKWLKTGRGREFLKSVLRGGVGTRRSS